MGTVIDEETGEEPACPHCRSTDDCPHLLAVIDRSCAECSGGALFGALDDLRELLAAKIGAALRSGKESWSSAGDAEIAAIAEEARENYDPESPDAVYIDEDMFLEWIAEALLAAGAEELPGSFVEEGGPGQSSALTLLYAAKPARVLKAVEKVLRRAVAEL